MKRTISVRGLVLVGLVSAALTASAAPASLVPNQLLSDVPATSGPTALGTLIFSSVNDFSGADVDGDVTFTGSLTSLVYRGNDNTLAFVYSVENDATSIDAIERLSLTSFSGFTTAVEQGTGNGSDVLASSASRSANGKVVSFGYAPGSTYGSILPGLQSRYAVVFTNATEFDSGSAQFISGGVATAQTFVPTAVPEPASLAVIGVGAAALLRRRRRS